MNALKKVLVMGGMGIFLLSAGITAEAAEVESGIYTLTNNSNTEVVMGVTGGYWDDATELICVYNEDTNYEKFNIQQTEDGMYTIQAVHSEKYIQTAEDNVLRQYSELLGTGSEKWILADMGNGSYQIQDSNGYCIGIEGTTADNGVRIVLGTVDAEDATKIWTLTPASKNEEEVTIAANEGDFVELADGIYEISALLNSEICWAMSQEEETSHLILWSRSNDETQQFQITKVREAEDGSVLYSITPVSLSEKVLQRDANEYIEAADYVDNLGSQLWQFVYAGYGTYLIRCVDGIFVNCPDGSAYDGEGLVLVDYEAVEDTSYMRWFITESVIEE
ncbi:MAG: RICIN domain-containing protein [Clostridiales bacterium]|nr:RICIN domain-containing protein [Clostridiales bacterium]